MVMSQRGMYVAITVWDTDPICATIGIVGISTWCQLIFGRVTLFSNIDPMREYMILPVIIMILLIYVLVGVLMYSYHSVYTFHHTNWWILNNRIPFTIIIRVTITPGAQSRTPRRNYKKLVSIISFIEDRPMVLTAGPLRSSEYPSIFLDILLNLSATVKCCRMYFIVVSLTKMSAATFVSTMLILQYFTPNDNYKCKTTVCWIHWRFAVTT